MAKISHGADTWRSEGLAKKYKEQASFETLKNKHKSKKNTRKWCKGKVGVQHDLIRYFKYYGWTSKRSKYIQCRCKVCGKEFYNKSSSIPLIIELDNKDGKSYPIQVKVNGIANPIDYRLFHDENLWCEHCQEWHVDY